jgi:hypothetical protein
MIGDNFGMDRVRTMVLAMNAAPRWSKIGDFVRLGHESRTPTPWWSMIGDFVHRNSSGKVKNLFTRQLFLDMHGLIYLVNKT